MIHNFQTFFLSAFFLFQLPVPLIYISCNFTYVLMDKAKAITFSEIRPESLAGNIFPFLTPLYC